MWCHAHLDLDPSECLRSQRLHSPTAILTPPGALPLAGRCQTSTAEVAGPADGITAPGEPACRKVLFWQLCKWCRLRASVSHLSLQKPPCFMVDTSHRCLFCRACASRQTGGLTVTASLAWSVCERSLIHQRQIETVRTQALEDLGMRLPP